MNSFVVRRQLPVIHSQMIVRWLHLHEYQSHDLFRRFGVPVPRGAPAMSLDESLHVGETLLSRSPSVMVKAQVLAGARGRGMFSSGLSGGVHRARTLDEIGVLSKKMLRHSLKTKQTGCGGLPCNTIYLQEALSDIEGREKYVAILLDRSMDGVCAVVTSRGGGSVEEIAAKYPDCVLKERVSSRSAAERDAKFASLVKRMKFSTQKAEKHAYEVMHGMYSVLTGSDALLVEVNPLVDVGKGVVCLDAKIEIDDAAEYRQRSLCSLRDETQEDKLEVLARRAGLSFVKLDGNVGCMVNGAGLAMATMDLVKSYGGNPANFLDIGGGVNEKNGLEAFRILMRSGVDVIFVNVFGGIVHCDLVARALIACTREVKINVPVVVCLNGTNAEKGMEILRDSGNDMIQCVSTFEDGARLACKNSKRRK